MSSIIRIFPLLFKKLPFTTLFLFINYLIDAARPAVIAVISIRLFEGIADTLNPDVYFNTNNLYIYAALFVGVMLLGDFIENISSIPQGWFYDKGSIIMKSIIFDKSAKLSLLKYEDDNVLDMKERAISSVDDNAPQLFFIEGVLMGRFILIIVGLAAVLATYNIWLLPLSVLTVLPYLYVRIVRGTEMYSIRRFQAKRGRFLNYLWELLSTSSPAKEIRTMGFGGYISEKWMNLRDEINEEHWAHNKKESISMLICDIIRLIGYGVSIAVVVVLVINGDLSVAVLGVALTAFLVMQENFREFFSAVGNVSENIGFVKDFFEFIDLPEKKYGDRNFPGLTNNITAKNITFSYPNQEENALQSVDFTINKGETIAVVGENGSGKTTLVKLLLGLYETDSGEVMYDGVPVKSLSESYLKHISIVSQDFVRYHLPLKECVALSSLDDLNNENKLRQTIQSAGLNFTNLNEELGREFGGLELSGGEWQKLAIARGMFKDSEIIVLDEPTAALDPLIESEILSMFINAAKSRTTIIVSHRVGICRFVDKIVVMDGGRIVEVGSHDELMKKDGTYSKLFTSQAQWYQ